MENQGVQTRAMAARAIREQENHSVNGTPDNRRASFTSEPEHFEDARESNQSLMRISPPVDLVPPSVSSINGSYRDKIGQAKETSRTELQAQINALRTQSNQTKHDLHLQRELQSYKEIARTLEAEKNELLHMLAEKEDIIERLQHDLNNVQMHTMAHTPIQQQHDNSQSRPNRPMANQSKSAHVPKLDKPSIKYDMDDEHQEDVQYDDLWEADRPWRNRRKEAVRNRNYRRSSNDYPKQDNNHFENASWGAPAWETKSRSAFQKISEKDLPTFDDQSEMITAWISKIDIKQELYALSDKDIIQALPTMFQGTAREWLMGVIKSLMRKLGHNWTQWKQALMEQFYDHEKMHRLRTEYRTLNHQKFNSFSSFIKKKYSLRALIYGEDIPEGESDATLIEDVLQYFSPLSVGMFKTIYLQKGIELTGWIQFARNIDNFLSSYEAQQQHDPCVLYKKQLQARRDNRRTSTDSTGVHNVSTPSKPFEIRCNRCGSRDHASNACIASQEMKLSCEKCGYKNHTTEMHRGSMSSRVRLQNSNGSDRQTVKTHVTWQSADNDPDSDVSSSALDEMYDSEEDFQ